MTEPSFDQIKASLRATWMAGDFGVIARQTAKIAAAFAEGLAIPQGAQALDVACGTGNVAIPLARQGCVVTGVDIAPNLLEQARSRAAAEGVAATFDEGDAEHLPYGDGTFDAVVSMFGAMFAPRPERVAAEAARVLRPGGLLGMANWTPGGFAGRMFKVNGMHVPPPPGLEPPVRWGDATVVRERLEPYFTEIRTEPVAIQFDYSTGTAAVVEMFRQYFGPTQMAFSRLDAEGQRAYERDLIALWNEANEAADPENRTVVRNEYLRVTARKK
jgi:ubiquinone/menaquinone biosynthesis C-methylase UbiE